MPPRPYILACAVEYHDVTRTRTSGFVENVQWLGNVVNNYIVRTSLLLIINSDERSYTCVSLKFIQIQTYQHWRNKNSQALLAWFYNSTIQQREHCAYLLIEFSKNILTAHIYFKAILLEAGVRREGSVSQKLGKYQSS